MACKRQLVYVWILVLALLLIMTQTTVHKLNSVPGIGPVQGYLRVETDPSSLNHAHVIPTQTQGAHNTFMQTLLAVNDIIYDDTPSPPPISSAATHTRDATTLFTSSPTPPTRVTSPQAKVLKIASGGDVTCALMEYGQVKCFGQGAFGQLGSGAVSSLGASLGSMGDNLLPIDLGVESVLEVSVGKRHACAVTMQNELLCWGEGLNGELGLAIGVTIIGDESGEMGQNLTRAKIGRHWTVKHVAAGDGFTCALLGQGALKCFGNGAGGRLGQGSTLSVGIERHSMGNNLSVIDLGSNRWARQVCTGASHACAILDNYSLKCWGSARYGQIGSGSTENLGDEPGEMGDFLPVVLMGTAVHALQVSCGDDHTCVRLNSSLIKCFGRNDHGQLGIGSTVNRGLSPGEMGNNLPEVPLHRVVTRVECGGNVSCAILDDHSVKCWGEGTNGQLLRETTDNLGDEESDVIGPLTLSQNPGIVALSLGSRHTCAIFGHKLPGSISCWGNDDHGQLGFEGQSRSNQTLTFGNLGSPEIVLQRLFEEDSSDSVSCSFALNPGQAKTCRRVAVNVSELLVARKISVQFDLSTPERVMVKELLPPSYPEPSKWDSILSFNYQADLLNPLPVAFTVNPLKGTVLANFHVENGTWIIGPCYFGEISSYDGLSCHTWSFMASDVDDDYCDVTSTQETKTNQTTAQRESRQVLLNVTIEVNNSISETTLNFTAEPAGYTTGNWKGDPMCDRTPDASLSESGFFCCGGCKEECLPAEECEPDDKCCGVVATARSCRDFPPPCSMVAVQKIAFHITAQALALLGEGAINFIRTQVRDANEAYRKSRIPIEWVSILPDLSDPDAVIQPAETVEADADSDPGANDTRKRQVLLDEFVRKDLAPKQALGERVFHMLIIDKQERLFLKGGRALVDCRTALTLCHGWVDQSAAVRQYSLLYEVGLLPGGKHEFGDARYRDSSDDGSHGYVHYEEPLFRTFMAREDPQVAIPRVGIFSNPKIMYAEINGAPAGDEKPAKAARFISDKRFYNAASKTLVASCGDEGVVGIYYSLHEIDGKAAYFTNIGFLCWRGGGDARMTEPVFGEESQGDVIQKIDVQFCLGQFYFLFPVLYYVKGIHIEHTMLTTSSGAQVLSPCRINLLCQSIFGDFWSHDEIAFGPCLDENVVKTNCVDKSCNGVLNTVTAVSDKAIYGVPTNAVVPGQMVDADCKGEPEAHYPTPLPTPSGCSP